MPRPCYRKYPKTIGFPCNLCEDLEQCKKAYLIVDLVIHYCRSSQDPSGEYSSDYKIDFILSEPCPLNIYGETYVIDRIRMLPSWGDNLRLVFAGENIEFDSIKIPRRMILSLYRRILKEQKRGALKGWVFDEDIAELYSRTFNPIKTSVECRECGFHDNNAAIENYKTNEKGHFECPECNTVLLVTEDQ